MVIRMRFVEAIVLPRLMRRRYAKSPALRIGLFPSLSASALAAVLSIAPAARAEQPAAESNQCVACHQVEQLPISLGHSLTEWRASEHARSGVGCEKCHGGDASARDAKAAHVGVLPSSDRASKVSSHNLAATCGTCHKNEYNAYKNTVHAKESTDENVDAANCVTCHGSMATSYPTPQELNSRCTVCHERPVEARAALSWLASAKIQLLRTRRTLDTAKEVSPDWHADALKRFHEMERSYEQISLKWHQFNMKDSVHESRNLLGLGKLLDEEARLKMKIDKEKKPN